MSDFPTEPKTGNNVVRHLLDQLRRHPKRVVFTEGEDIRVIEAAARLVKEEVVAPILLGNRERIRALAAEHSVPLKFIHVIDPPNASDFGLFCQRVENMARYRTMQLGNPEEIVARPHYFGALMVQYGQADAIVGGNQALPAAYFRALLHTIKPLPTVPKIFGVSLLIGPHLKNLGGSGILLLADCALIPNPDRRGTRLHRLGNRQAGPSFPRSETARRDAQPLDQRQRRHAGRPPHGRRRRARPSRSR